MINNEQEFYKKMDELRKEKRITEEEYNDITNYLCGIFDALSGMGMYEDDLDW